MEYCRYPSVTAQLTITIICRDGIEFDNHNVTCISDITSPENIRKIVVNWYEEPGFENDPDVIVHHEKKITLFTYDSDNGIEYSEVYECPEGQDGFTERDLVNCVLKHEKLHRVHIMYFDEIDLTHTYFEGLRLCGNKYIIDWGS